MLYAGFTTVRRQTWKFVSHSNDRFVCAVLRSVFIHSSAWVRAASRLARVPRCGTRYCPWVSWTARSCPTTDPMSWRTASTWRRSRRPSPGFWSHGRLPIHLLCTGTPLWTTKWKCARVRLVYWTERSRR